MYNYSWRARPPSLTPRRSGAQVHVILFGVGDFETEGIYSLRALRREDNLPQDTIIAFEDDEDAERCGLWVSAWPQYCCKSGARFNGSQSQRIASCRCDACPCHKSRTVCPMPLFQRASHILCSQLQGLRNMHPRSLLHESTNHGLPEATMVHKPHMRPQHASGGAEL